MLLGIVLGIFGVVALGSAVIAPFAVDELNKIQNQ